MSIWILNNLNEDLKRNNVTVVAGSASRCCYRYGSCRRLRREHVGGYVLRVNSLLRGNIECIYTEMLDTSWTVRNTDEDKEGERHCKSYFKRPGKMKGMKYSTVKGCRQFLIHRIRHLHPEKRAKKNRVAGRERGRDDDWKVEGEGMNRVCCSELVPQEHIKWTVLLCVGV